MTCYSFLNYMKIVFVYNAESGFLNFCKDALHKWFSPATYPCKLCDLTYSNVGEKKIWREYYNALPIPCEFLYRDTFIDHFPNAKLPPLPCVFLFNEHGIHPLVSVLEFSHIDDVKQLQSAIDSALKNHSTVLPFA